MSPIPERTARPGANGAFVNVYRPRLNSGPRLRAWTRLLAGAAILAVAAGCRASSTPAPGAMVVPGDENGFLDTLEARTFRWFWDLSDSANGLTPDRWPTPSFRSISATGFALTSYPIGVERGYVSRAAAAGRARTTLEFLWTAPQGTAPAGVIGYKGFYYHFLNRDDGMRFRDVELSTVDTALLLMGALACRDYFDRPDPAEAAVRALADSIYARVDWTWAQVRPPAIGHGWSPEQGFLPYDWKGYSEAMLVYLLALGSPTHPVGPGAWDAWCSKYEWGTFHDRSYVGIGPLFCYQYTHVWVDFRGIQDAYMRGRGIDYFENSRRATLAQRAYAEENPGKWRGYGPDVWGLTACDGPTDSTIVVDGMSREFHTYWGRGASFLGGRDDGTIAPTAAGGSLAFTPEASVPALMTMAKLYGSDLFTPYGFVDSFNPTLNVAVPVRQGKVVPGKGWFDTDYLGIDQGPILAMAENHRTGFVWRLLRGDPDLVRGLRQAGFSGGWLDSVTVGR